MSANKASILAIGDELISGKTQDLNCSFLAKALALYGVEVESVSFVGDQQEAISLALARLAEQSRLVVTTGGIGPTADDITRYCVAGFSGRELELRQECLDKLLAFLKERGRELTETNKRQAFIPSGATVVANDFGTADGFITPFSTSENSGLILTLPGVPREMRALADKSLPIVCAQLFNVSAKRSEVVLQIFGVPESDIGAKIEALNFPEALNVAYRPHFPMVSVELISEDKQLVEKSAKAVIAAVGEQFVFSKVRAEKMAATVGKLLCERKLSLAAAESCTGGLIGHRIVSEAGSSEYFKGGIVSYSNEAKRDLLGVGEELLSSYGAVSCQVAVAMAEGARSRLSTDIGISVTGIAGPDGGTIEKPVGTVCFGYADSEGSFGLRYKFSGNRDSIRKLSAMVALDIIRRKIAGVPGFYPNLAENFKK